jgi:hypothetical protein
MTQARQVHDDSPVTLQAAAATYVADMTVAAMVLGRVPPAREWDLLDRGVHTMQARCCPTSPPWGSASSSFTRGPTDRWRRTCRR